MGEYKYITEGDNGEIIYHNGKMFSHLFKGLLNDIKKSSKLISTEQIGTHVFTTYEDWSNIYIVEYSKSRKRYKEITIKDR